MLVVPNEGELEMLKRVLNMASADEVFIKLYTNTLTIDDDVAVGDFIEPTNNGYSAIEINSNGTVPFWVISTDGSGLTSAVADEITFTFDPSASATDVYGYFVTNTAGTILLWAEEFDSAPFTIPAGGGDIKIVPKIELS